jgi:hypothetical protein
VTTHDMPTLRSFWEGRDIDLRRSLNLYPSAELEGIIREARDRDRKALLEALAGQGLKPSAPASPGDPFTPELAQALHIYLARSSAALAAVQIEDLLGMDGAGQCSRDLSRVSQLAAQSSPSGVWRTWRRARISMDGSRSYAAHAGAEGSRSGYGGSAGVVIGFPLGCASAPTAQTAAAIRMAIGTIFTAWASEEASDSMPMMMGEGTSPSK